MAKDKAVTIDEIREAASRIAPHAHRTPVVTNATLNDRCGAQVFLKCESFQRGGAFKFRGASNAVFSLSDESLRRGVATHSSGNHAAALALAARIRGCAAHIVMPRNAPAVKRAAVEGYGGRITFCEPTLASREETLAAVVEETGAEVVHPYNDRRVIAGQGTASMELIEEVPGLDVVIAPVGGGGLLSGTAIAAAALAPGSVVYGAEPANADDAARSLAAGRIVPSENPQTVADGLRTSLGTLTFEILSSRIAGIVTVGEDEILEAMRFVWERAKIVIEPSSAVPVAAVLTGRLDVRGRRVGIIISGGNVDLDSVRFR